MTPTSKKPDPAQSSGAELALLEVEGDKNTSILLPVIDIDYSKPPGEQTFPCSDQKQAIDLGWDIGAVRAANRNLGIYDNIPLLCKGQECHWASLCPTKEYDYPFKGRKCPLEIIEAYRLFVHYVRELDVDATKFVDLKMVSDLVRLDLQISRIDQTIQAQGMMTNQVVAVAQSYGKAIKEASPHKLLNEQRQLRKDQARIYSTLLAGRNDKRKAAEANKAEREAKIASFKKIISAISGAMNQNTSQQGTIIEAEAKIE